MPGNVCAMTILDPAADLAGGAIALPGDDGYDAARQIFNLALDQRPAAVAFPSDADQVAEIVRWARDRGLRVSGQSTGHNAGPLGSLEQTVLIRTSGLGGVEIDPVGETCRAGAGVLWEEVVDAAAPHGLIALHGSAPTVGITGYSLGGGMGWLARSHGLQTNSVTAVELVTADGELIRTDADNDPELFWALRGGGGNFGIVTALEFKLYPLTEIYAGFMLWDWTEAERVLTGWAEWAADAPDGVTTSLRIMQLPPDPALPPFLSGRQIVLIDGAAQDPSLIEPLRALGPEIDTFATVPAPSLVRLHQDPEEPLPYTTASALVESLPAAAIKAFVESIGPGSGSPLLVAELRQCGGALGRIAPGAGAVARINGEFVLFLCGIAAEPAMGAAMEGHMEVVKAAMEPFSGPGYYLNFAEHPVDTSLSFDIDTWARLVAIKDRVDPQNVIHANHAI